MEGGTSLDNRILSFATVKETNDPLMLNRIRVEFDLENQQSIIDSVQSPNGKNIKTVDGSDLLPEYKWGELDPFCCLPLLPIYLNLTPKVGESVNIIFPKNDRKFNEQYYIAGIVSSPLTMYKDNNNAQRMFAAKNRLQNPQFLKNPITDEFYKSNMAGIFPEPLDFGLLGRGTADMILKERDVLLRAGKSLGLPDNANKDLEANPKRAFIQLSDFTQKQKLESPKETQKLLENISYIKTLVEWEVSNFDNPRQIYNYSVSVYRLPEKPEYTTKTVNLTSDISPLDKALVYRFSEQASSKENMIANINKVLSQCNDGELNLPNTPITQLTNQFPLYYRPTESTYKLLQTATDPTAISLMNGVMNSISLKQIFQGYGLLSSRDKTGPQFTQTTDVLNQKSINPDTPTTYNVQGSDNIILLSHNSRIPSKKQITLDKDGIYGIGQDDLVENILPNTSPMVRGDELMKLINAIWNYFVAHTHNINSTPNTVANKISEQQITTMIADASQTILNQNIRIN